VLNPDGSWSGTATGGSYPLDLRVCDDQVPPACTDFTMVLVVSLLPVTGMSNAGRDLRRIHHAVAGLAVAARDPTAEALGTADLT
jgi:hypothetical protein